MNKRKSIVFDLDGTLIDISQRDYQVYVDCVISYNGHAIDFVEYWKLRRAKTNIFKILKRSEINEKYFNDFIHSRNSSIEQTNYLSIDTLFTNAKKHLSELQSNYKLYLLTRRQNEKDTLTQLETLEIQNFFSEIYVVSGDKTDVLNTISDAAVMVGDTENDILPANKLGIYSVAVLTGIRDENSLSTIEPNQIISDLSKLPNILEVL